MLVSVVYFYAGVAKINEDWLRAEPLLHWLRNKEVPQFLQLILDEPITAFVFSYGNYNHN